MLCSLSVHATSSGAIHKANPEAATQALHWVMEMYAEGRCTDYRLQYASMPPSVAALQLHLQTILASSKHLKITHLWTPPNQVMQQPAIPHVCCLLYCLLGGGSCLSCSLSIGAALGCGGACGTTLQTPAGPHAYLSRVSA